MKRSKIARILKLFIFFAAMKFTLIAMETIPSSTITSNLNVFPLQEPNPESSMQSVRKMPPPLISVKKKSNINPTHTTTFIAECDMPTSYGNFRMQSYLYTSPYQKLEPLVLIHGNVRNRENVLVRVHDQCCTSEVFGSLRCDCKSQLEQSIDMIKSEGDGMIRYLQQEGRGIGISNKIAAYSLQDLGEDTISANVKLGFHAEMRSYHTIADILTHLNISSVRLMTNNPYKINNLMSLGVKVTGRVGVQVKANSHNLKYLETKRQAMQHILDEDHPSHTPPVDTINRDYAYGKQSVLLAIEAIRRGEIVIVVDDANRENEGDFIIAAMHATPSNIGFMIRHSSGVLCISLDEERLNTLKLPSMVISNEDPKGTAYTVSVDAKNTTTGISARDRATTFAQLVNPSYKASDFQRPGHVFPLRYRNDGVLVRRGHTEASYDLTVLAGLEKKGGVLAEIVKDDGDLMRGEELEEFAKKNGLVMTSVQDIAAYRLETENPI